MAAELCRLHTTTTTITGVCIIPFMSRMSDNIFGDDWYVSTEAQAARQTRPSAVAFHMRQTFPPMLAGADWVRTDQRAQ